MKTTSSYHSVKVVSARQHNRGRQHYGFLAGAFLAGSVMLVAGCSTGPPSGDVFGQVTLDGTNVSEGSIQFIPLDGKTASAGTRIQNGQFEMKHVPVNNFRVEISWPKISGGSKGGDATTGEGGLAIELVPAKYNLNSTLKCDVKEGANKADFPLVSK